MPDLGISIDGFAQLLELVSIFELLNLFKFSLGLYLVLLGHHFPGMIFG